MRSLTTSTLTLMPLAIVIDIVAGQLTAVLRLPLYLDSVGTVLVGVLAGPLAGALTGALSNVLWGLVASPAALAFALTGALVGALAGWFARLGWFRRGWAAAAAGLISGVLAAVASAPVAAYLFGGVTGGGTDALVAFFQSVGANIFQAALGQSLVSDPLDKLVVFALVWAVVRSLPERQRARFGGHA